MEKEKEKNGTLKRNVGVYTLVEGKKQRNYWWRQKKSWASRRSQNGTVTYNHYRGIFQGDGQYYQGKGLIMDYEHWEKTNSSLSK